ncbi:MAG: nucleotidyltransferase domain-containing protein [Dokdonella sp.]
MHTPLERTTQINAAVSGLLALFDDVDALYVFGSVAEGSDGAGSDIDLALLCSAPIDPLRRFEAQRELSVQLRRDVDLIDLMRASTVLREQIIEKGKLIHVRHADKVLDFEGRALTDYAELMDATRELREAVRRDGIAYAP